MALNYFLYAGWEGIWIGLENASPYEKQLLNIGKNNPYSSNPFDGLENRNPKLIERQLR